jgi:hypothetical protein
MGRLGVFLVQIAWLVALGAVAAAFFIHRTFIPLPDHLGPVPLAVVWFGALGAVLISLTGIIEHGKDWDTAFDLWHLSRPLIGGSLAVVSVLILQAGVLAIGAAPAPNTPQNLLYYLVAFMVGYREETFRELMKRLVDLILTPAPAVPAPTITGLNPPTGPIAGGIPVVILGAGFAQASSVIFGTQPAKFHVDSDTQITAQLPPTPAAGQTSVTVTTGTGSVTSPFTYA